MQYIFKRTEEFFSTLKNQVHFLLVNNVSDAKEENFFADRQVFIVFSL